MFRFSKSNVLHYGRGNKRLSDVILKKKKKKKKKCISQNKTMRASVQTR